MVVLDFEGVTEVGRAFVDELFRVWAPRHPERWRPSPYRCHPLSSGWSGPFGLDRVRRAETPQSRLRSSMYFFSPRSGRIHAADQRRGPDDHRGRQPRPDPVDREPIGNQVGDDQSDQCGDQRHTAERGRLPTCGLVRQERRHQTRRRP